MMFVLKMINSLNCKEMIKNRKIKCINPRNTGNYVGFTFCCGCIDPLSLKKISIIEQEKMIFTLAFTYRMMYNDNKGRGIENV